MADTLTIGLSALLAQQRALTTVSNNIGNVNTPGYSRQRVEFSERPAEALGRTFIGTGVDIGSVRRLTDALLVGQVNDAAARFFRADTFSGLASVLDNLLANSQTGLTAGLQDFFNAVQDLADDPASTAARQALLTAGQSLGARLNAFDDRLTSLERETAGRAVGAVTEINGIAGSIAAVNQQLLASGASRGGQFPPDLLDERDRLVSRLAELVRVDTATQADGTLNVFIGSGQSLVLGGEATQLAVVPGDLDPQRFEIVVQSPTGPPLTITDFLSGGELGGALDFRREMLEPIGNEIGRITVVLAERFNAVHREGMDLNDALGGDFFAVAPPQTYASQNNTGTGSVTLGIANLGGLEASSYLLNYDGAAYSLFSVATGNSVAMTGSGSVADPFVAAGMSFVINGSPAAGDLFRLEPVTGAAGSLNVTITDTRGIAAAAPIRTSAASANTGTAAITPGEVVDIAAPGLLSTSTIQFIDANNYSINGAGSFAYTPGADITINGARVQINGVAAAGDTFLIEPNFGGVGDNRNGLRLAGIGVEGLMAAGSTSLLEGAGQVVGQVGAQVLRSTSERDVQNALLRQVEADLSSVTGVNLDEEAADLLRYQQAYEAAARTIAVADSLFQSLLQALR